MCPNNQIGLFSEYHIPENTVIFINNHHSNFSTEYWDGPEQYRPERFLNKEGRFRKPAHFLPFSTGRRSCIGYKIVQLVATAIAASTLRYTQFSDRHGGKS